MKTGRVATTRAGRSIAAVLLDETATPIPSPARDRRKVQCKHFRVECENCGEAVYPNDPERGGMGIEGHDCVQVLKANLKAAREEIARLKGGGGDVFGGAPNIGGGFYGAPNLGGG